MPYEDRYAEAFKRLNSEWLNHHGHLISKDLAYLNKPRQTIIKPGGKILMAVMNGIVVATCAIIKKITLQQNLQNCLFLWIFAEKELVVCSPL